MPNHLHLIWQLLKENGKESPAAAFKKYTAHEFEKKMRFFIPGRFRKLSGKLEI